MKIYESVTIDMSTFEVVDEKSYEYYGEVAECKGSVQTSYATSPQQDRALSAVMPVLQRIGAQGGAGQPLYDVPSAPNISGYQTPSTENLLPTSNWFGNMSPEVMSGIQAPYEATYKTLMEQMGAGGASGSARGGLSGAAGAASGRFAADAAKGIGQQAWQMTQPGLQAGYASELGQNQWLATQKANTQMQEWAAKVGALQAPYGLGAQAGIGALPETFGAGSKK